MRKLIFVAGVAALAVTAPAVAKPDKGGGGHDDNAQAQSGRGGKAKAQRGGDSGRQAQAQRGGGGGQAKAQRVENRRGGQAQLMERRGGGERQAQRVEHRGGDQKRFANFQSDHGNRKAQRVENRNHGNRDFARIENRGRGKDRTETQNRGGRDQRIAIDRGEFRGAEREFARVRGDNVARYRGLDDDRFALRSREDYGRYTQWRDWDDDDWNRRYAYREIPAAYVGCPPGLAKKSPPCVPPGHARNAYVGRVLPTYYASNYFPRSLGYIYADTPDYYYRYGDGYAYRVNRSNNLIAALLPLIGAGYGVGQTFPYSGPGYYVPSYYQPFYQNSPYDYYRYDDGYVYRIDAASGYIGDVIPLLDRGYGLGQMLPAGYSYYNVPYQYRDYYYDTPDYNYRYAPGAIYQVDAGTQLITAIASLLTGGLSVGQPLPPAYSVYNVPMAYRTQYYDTPNAWYRYSDGYIYQIDPATRLITAMVTAALV